MKALLKNFRQSPRKVRLVADAIRGEDVERARRFLQFDVHKSSSPLLKLLDSAVANAHQVGKSPEHLYVKEILVDLSLMLKRGMPMSRGRSSIIRHRYSRVALTLAEKKPQTSKVAKKVVAKKKPTTAKKTTAKKAAAKKTTVKKAAKKAATK